MMSIIEFVDESSIRDSGNVHLLRWWNACRGEGNAVKRRRADPRAFSFLMPDMFILGAPDEDTGGRGRHWRFAGSRIECTFVHGIFRQPFHSFWSENSRLTAVRTLALAARQCLPFVFILKNSMESDESEAGGLAIECLGLPMLSLTGERLHFIGAMRVIAGAQDRSCPPLAQAEIAQAGVVAIAGAADIRAVITGGEVDTRVPARTSPAKLRLVR